MMKRLASLLEELQARYDAFMDESLSEEESDALYALYWEKVEESASVVESISLGSIDHKTAMKMVLHRRADILSLLARAA
ncbi:MAG: hypothetical protein DELT_02559 [Desulfovibrio sp.]